MSLFCSIIPKHIDTSLPYLHWFKNSIMTEIRPLNSQPFTKGLYHFPIILESVTCQVLLQWSELHYRFLCLSSGKMHMFHHLSTAYFHHDRTFKLVTRWGKCINFDGECDEKDDSSVGLEAVMTFHWFSGTLKPYLLHITCRFQKTTPVFQKL